MLAVAAIVGCQPAGGRTLDVPQGGFRLHVPDGWDAQATAPSEWPRGLTVALLSTHPLDPVCTSTGAPRCSAPARSLAEGQLLVWWRSTTCAGAACQPPEAMPTLVGGRAAARVVDVSVCEGLEATGGEAYFVVVSPQRLDAVVVCERSAPDAAREGLRRVLETVDWRTP